jgi:hypothetical protein
MSSHSGFNKAAVPSLSLCARQILFQEARQVEEIKDLVSHDDGDTWESVLLGAGSTPQKAAKPKSKPVRLEILSVAPCLDSPSSITLLHKTGSMTVKPTLLELRKRKNGHDLWVLGTPRGVYAAEVDEGTSLLLQAAGVAVKGEGDAASNGFVKAWKPALFKIHQREGEPLEVRGFMRGLLGIDRRSVERTSTYGKGEHSRSYTYTSLLWHLSHIPTGFLIASWKHRNTAQEFADLLRERTPELTDTGMEITPEVGKQVKQILDEFSA